VNLIDLAPTLAAHLGVKLSGIDGKPVSDFFQSDDLQRGSNA
jgi:arylsulfatase A-like enzyme